MPVKIKIEGLTPDQEQHLLEGLLRYYGPKPDELSLTDKQWVMLQLWREIKRKLAHVAWRDAEEALQRDMENRREAIGEAVEREFGDEVS